MELDFLYVPSSNVAADAGYWVNVLGARLVFAVDGMGARVAMLELGSSGPRVLLTDHLEDKRTVLIYRVDDLDRTMKELRSKGWKKGRSLEIPHGPCVSFATPGGQRVAIYELARPEVAESFVGRIDFELGGAGAKKKTPLR
jgi:hypothetical protein